MKEDRPNTCSVLTLQPIIDVHIKMIHEVKSYHVYGNSEEEGDAVSDSKTSS